jgi:hypothetical protein
MKERARRKEMNKAMWLVAAALIFLLVLNLTYASTPEGPDITVSGNSSRPTSNGTKVNATGGSGETSGGYVFTINLDTLQTNTRWKAYYGNVSGTMTLDDASGYTIYKWPITSTVNGNVYATRASGTIAWASAVCANSTQIEAENRAINQTSNPSDNITATFNSTNHSTFVVAGNSLNNCSSTVTYKNDTAMAQNDTADFQEIVIYDGTNIIYATNIENNVMSYNGAPADFQMIVPENGLATWQSSTAYYFYVELQ